MLFSPGLPVPGSDADNVARVGILLNGDRSEPLTSMLKESQTVSVAPAVAGVVVGGK